MIITEDTPASPVKATTPLLPNTANGASGSAPPPAYSARQPGAPSPPGPIYYQAVYPTPNAMQSSPPEPTWKRFAKAFVVAVLIWSLFGALVRSMSEKSLIGRGASYPIPPEVSTNRCVSQWGLSEVTRNPPFSTYAYAATKTFKFPVPDATLLLLSKGALSAGRLHVSAGTGDEVQVRVTVDYDEKTVRDLAKICMVEREAGEAGLGIFTPKYWRTYGRFPRLFFRVELVLPRGVSHVNALETDVSNFAHDVDLFAGLIEFGTLNLGGSNGDIHTQSVRAGNASLTTSNGKIVADRLVSPTIKLKSSNSQVSGQFVASESFNLDTSNGKVIVDLTMNSDDPSVAKKVSIYTSNHELDALIKLSTPSGTGGIFPVDVATSNGKLSAKILSAPIDTTLRVNARTSNALAVLELPATYEGTFEVATSNAATAVHQANPDVPDPKCRRRGPSCGRSRQLVTRMHSKGTVAGSVYWDRENEARGEAVLKSSNGPAAIYL
ncbi:unnamed protein product [Mycena citricolor]|uniref:DUF4097 domain-containing protein n=1 Tax=Mycena citricolor TaxID=2018698 RepID=A0AAD2HPN5_9AGAR|nr:unnamed protein product [Mycena citricolor]